MMIKKGKLIILEGIDGVGKSTIADELIKHYEQKTDVKFIKTREPGGTELAELIRNKIFEYGPELNKKLQLELFNTARILHFMDKIKPALDAGTNVLCDRHYLSTIVYQNANIRKVTQMTRDILGDYEDDTYSLILNPTDSAKILVDGKGDKNSYDGDVKDLEKKQKAYINLFLTQDQTNLVGDVYIFDVTRNLQENVNIMVDIIDNILQD